MVDSGKFLDYDASFNGYLQNQNGFYEAANRSLDNSVVWNEISEFKDKAQEISDQMKHEDEVFIRNLDENRSKVRDWKKRNVDLYSSFHEMFIDGSDYDENLNDFDELKLFQNDDSSQTSSLKFASQRDSLLKTDILDQFMDSIKSTFVLSKSSLNLLRAKIEMYKRNRKKTLNTKADNSYSRNKALKVSSKNLLEILQGSEATVPSLLASCKQLSSTPGKKAALTKNAKKIEKAIQHFFNAYNGSLYHDPLEELILKKHKFHDETYISKPSLLVGYKHSDFRKLEKYKIDPFKIPSLSSKFDEVKKSPHEHQSNYHTSSLEAFKARINRANLNKLKLVNKEKEHFNAQDLPLMSKEITYKSDSYLNYEDIPNNGKEKEQARQKLARMTQVEQDKYLKQLQKKSWQMVVRCVIRVYRFNQKERMDREQNCKRFAIACAREVRKRQSRNSRLHREFIFRAKRMHREMLVYWRKREKELNEIKKKKEKLENELRKRVEEEKEAALQKKRFIFLMKQSDIYAHFMARKLGIAIDQEEKMNLETVEGKMEVDADDDNKAFENIQSMINEQRENLINFDKETQMHRIAAGGPIGLLPELQECTMQDVKDAQNLDFSFVDQKAFTHIIQAPKNFKGELKEYQIKGLRWLDNLYDQGINGILADEMGLGKTIQAIALLAHISETKNNWGPFLVVAPSSTLYNWQQEIRRFCPSLKVLPYWGSLKQRKTLRKFFQMKNLCTMNSLFHVVVTSYQLVVADEKTFQRIKWQYMILDEAQAIKNINSQRWKILLGFNSRNKLLLTGTPIQNSMAELWALLHFIMPKLFDSHDQFQEWFSKDIEAHSQDQKALNQHQLQRLHAILKPFMLRRVKKDVEQEIGAKKEYQIPCEMTQRQKELYDRIKARLSVKDFFQMLESKSKVENLMNLVMQFRKICNHPELFERKPCRSPLYFHNFYYYTGNLPVSFGQLKDITYSSRNPITLGIPKLIYDDILSKPTKEQNLLKRFSIFNPDHIYRSLFTEAPGKNSINHLFNIFSFIRFIGMPTQLISLMFDQNSLYSQILLIHYFTFLKRKTFMYSDLETGRVNDKSTMFWIMPEFTELRGKETWAKIQTTENVKQRFLKKNPSKLLVYIPKVVAPIIDLYCPSASFTADFNERKRMSSGKRLLFGELTALSSSLFARSEKLPVTGRSFLPSNKGYISASLYPHSDMPSYIEIPDFASLIADSSKLNYLDGLLAKLKREDHRVLIFCQMTKMMDILEDYLMRKKYQYFRLDGSSNLADRRDMVHEYQTNDKIFAFLLSTRAGGLGVTLTAADTVIFYDNDWNPTMDAQATDRAHRIGQKKEVSVFRLVTKGTIEERIVKRAQQKQNVQATVYSGGAFKADIFKPHELMELLYDENELSKNEIDVNETKKFMSKSGSRKNKAKKKDAIINNQKKGKGEKPKRNFPKKGKGGANQDQFEDESGRMDMDIEEEEEEKLAGPKTQKEEEDNNELEMDFSAFMNNNDDD